MTTYTIKQDSSQSELSVLQAAVDRSLNFTEVVYVEWHGTRGELLVALAKVTDDDTDFAVESTGVIDVWGWSDQTKEGAMDWRLSVTMLQ